MGPASRYRLSTLKNSETTGAYITSVVGTSLLPDWSRWHRLYLSPLPQGHDWFLPTSLGLGVMGSTLNTTASADQPNSRTASPSGPSQGS